MFTAILFVCSLIDPTNCYKLVDNRGPYETEEKMPNTGRRND